jgi:porin
MTARFLCLIVAFGFWTVFPVVLDADPLSLPDPINVLNQPRLAGEFGGYRPAAESNGVVMNAQSISDLLGNTTGGMAEGTTYSGLLNLALSVDLQKAAGWEGASFKSSWLWLYGNNLSTRYIGNALTASSIAGYPAFRADELWFQQNFLHDAISLRGGLLALDTEFMISGTATLFVNSTFGAPALFSLDVPNGGPTYPMATPGVRLAFQPTSWLTLRSALTQANPFAQQVNRNGFDWNFGPYGGLLSLTEAEAAWNNGNNAFQSPGSGGLPGTVKGGFWIQNSQESLSANVAPGAYNTGLYGIIDQQLYAVPGNSTPATPSSGKNPVDDGKNPQPATPSCSCGSKGLSSFVRIGFSPEKSSPVGFYGDAGLVYTGLIPTRDTDKLGLAFAYAKVDSPVVSSPGSSDYPGTYEGVVELSYAIQLSQAISIQPDLQYVLHPGGTQQYGNALVVGARAVVNF